MADSKTARFRLVVVIGFILLENGNCRLISMLGNEKLVRSTQDLSELNVSQSFQDLSRKADHRRSTAHVKNGNNDLKLRVLVPTKNKFHEFVKVDHDPIGNGWTVSGYSVEVFKKVMGSLPYNVSCEFIPYHNGRHLDLGHYDELIQQFQFNVSSFLTLLFNYTSHSLNWAVPLFVFILILNYECRDMMQL